MVDYVVNDNLPRNQYGATIAQTVFTYTFVIEAATDILVYQTPSGSLANDAADILILNVDYTVTNVGDSNGGTIVLTVGAGGEDVLTLQRDAPVERTSDFNPGGFTAEELNSDLDRQTTFIQDNEMRISELSIRYPDSAVVDKPRDVDLPLLGPDEFWQMNSTKTGIIKAKLEPNPDVNTLRSELADNQAGSDGSRLVGYESTAAGSITVHAQLVKVDNNVAQLAINTPQIITNTANIATNTADIADLQSLENDTNLIIGGNFTTNPFQRLVSESPAGDAFVADRFLYKQDGAVTANTCAKITDAPPFSLSNYRTNHSLGSTVVNDIGSLAAGDYLGFSYIVEGFDFADILEKQAVLKFNVKSSITGTFSLAFQNETPDRYLVNEYTISAASTWETVELVLPNISFTGNWNIENGSGLRIYFTLAAGSTFQTSTLGTWQNGGDFRASNNQTNGLASPGNTFQVALVSLTVGTAVPLAFPYRSAEQEVALCQRYYEQSYEFGQQAAITETGEAIVEVHNGTGTNRFFVVNIPYKVEKRASPSIQLRSSAGTNGSWRGVSFIGTGAEGPVLVTFPSAAGFGVREVGTAWLVNNDIVGGHWEADAELT